MGLSHSISRAASLKELADRFLSDDELNMRSLARVTHSFTAVSGVVRSAVCLESKGNLVVVVAITSVDGRVTTQLADLMNGMASLDTVDILAQAEPGFRVRWEGMTGNSADDLPTLNSARRLVLLLDRPPTADEWRILGTPGLELSEVHVLEPGGSRKIPIPPPVARRDTEASLLVVDDDPLIVELVSQTLVDAGYEVVTATSGSEALTRLAGFDPDLIVSDVDMPGLNGFELVSHLRARPATRDIPLVFLTSNNRPEDIAQGLGLGADDYMIKPFDVRELLARVKAKIERPPAPWHRVGERAGILPFGRFKELVEAELERTSMGGRPGALAMIELSEMEFMVGMFGPGTGLEATRKVIDEVEDELGPLDAIARDGRGNLLLLSPETDSDATSAKLTRIATRLVESRIVLNGERLRVTPLSGFANFSEAEDIDHLFGIARVALDRARHDLDLIPIPYTPELGQPVEEKKPTRWAAFRRRATTPFQIAITIVIGFILPFIAYWRLDEAGYDITPVMYIVVVVALVITGALIWAEGILALRRLDPPERPAAPYPAATAIIAAYLPNEAATIEESVEAFLRLDYPNRLEVILAYNTPHELPIEDRLRELAQQYPHFKPIRIMNSTSKSQNVNAVLSQVTGEFIGVFDADHQPQQDSFRRAWRWLAEGYDVIQGHCVVRNGHSSWVARMVAVEFEAIYAVSHPGRARLHKFGIFGGSNGFWRASLLRTTRMQGFMLTEDIDSSMRAIESGARILSDPRLVSRELAPGSLMTLWHQRMRWAQGWFQVSLRHLFKGLRSKKLSVRQKFGLFWLLGWREIYPWLSVQMFPIIAYWAWTKGGVGALDWRVAIFVLTTIFTLSVGPAQTILSYKLADEEIRAQKRWFVFYLIVASFFYTEFKNTIARVAQIRHVMGENEWKVTARD